ncbi:15-hydroxyprostaglandin dehydrogenase [NAD(+)]-like isoform X1 [Periplaneta americana]|uniref:15-hydroxyprostaglandin dehydrogenase [NAD(+)]-like isoform X1 n=1 Tax=Periplaneta americana TaxID=6978 RepID=UPI0037E97A0F
MDLKDQVALVTGAAQGIGLATAKQLLKNGAKGVAICDIDSTKGEAATEDLNKEFGKGKAIFIKTDVTKQENLEEAFKKTKDTFKTINIVINNAGIFDHVGIHWEKVLDINVRGVVRGTKLAMEYMGKDKGGNGGTVVNIASVAGLGPNSSSSVYDGSKHFVVGYSQAMAFAPLSARHGVRVLTICPGFTDTPVAEGVLIGLQQLSLDTEAILSANPMQEPDHVGEAIIHALREGETGSVWVSGKRSAPYKVELPELVKSS